MAETPIGVPMPDFTKQNIPGVQEPETKQEDLLKAQKADTFAWSPNQINQVISTLKTQREEEAKKAYRVGQNQQTQATKLEITRYEQMITEETAKINQLVTEISALNQQKSQIEGEISSVTSRAASLRQQADSIRQQAVSIQAQIPSVSPTAPQPSNKSSLFMELALATEDLKKAVTPEEAAAAEDRYNKASYAYSLASNDWEAIKRATEARNDLVRKQAEELSIRQASDPTYVPVGMIGVYKKSDGVTVRSDDGKTWYQVGGDNQRLPNGQTGTSR